MISKSLLRFEREAKSIYRNMIKPFPGKNRIAISSFPSSASTYLKTLLSKVFDAPVVNIHTGYEYNEDALLRYYCSNFISNSHLPCRSPDVEKLNKFQLKPIILVRNIFDVLISAKDHTDRYDNFNPIIDRIPRCWQELSEERKKEVILKFYLPFYVNFYVSWYYAKVENRIHCEFLAHEDFTDDKKIFEKLPHVLNSIGVPTSKESLAKHKAIMQQERNGKKSEISKLINKGVKGRGSDYFSDDEKQYIFNYFTMYNDVDFEKIGIKK